MITKRFVLMAGSKYYASGGFNDYINSYDTKEEATAAMSKWIDDNNALYGEGMCWAHIGDLETGDVEQKGSACNPMGLLR